MSSINNTSSAKLPLFLVCRDTDRQRILQRLEQHKVFLKSYSLKESLFRIVYIYKIMKDVLSVGDNMRRFTCVISSILDQKLNRARSDNPQIYEKFLRMFTVCQQRESCGKSTQCASAQQCMDSGFRVDYTTFEDLLVEINEVGRSHSNIQVKVTGKDDSIQRFAKCMEFLFESPHSVTNIDDNCFSFEVTSSLNLARDAYITLSKFTAIFYDEMSKESKMREHAILFNLELRSVREDFAAVAPQGKLTSECLRKFEPGTVHSTSTTQTQSAIDSSSGEDDDNLDLNEELSDDEETPDNTPVVGDNVDEELSSDDDVIQEAPYIPLSDGREQIVPGASQHPEPSSPALRHIQRNIHFGEQGNIIDSNAEAEEDSIDPPAAKRAKINNDRADPPPLRLTTDMKYYPHLIVITCERNIDTHLEMTARQEVIHDKPSVVISVKTKISTSELVFPITTHKFRIVKALYTQGRTKVYVELKD